MEKLHKILFLVLFSNFVCCPFLEARYKWWGYDRWSYNNFPISIHIPMDLKIDLKNENLLQKAFRATMILCLGAFAMQSGYEGMKQRKEIPIFFSMALFCGGGFICAHAATLFKRVYENLGHKELF